ncbi:helix-turn-helix domain-containing protein [Pelagibacterium nitratireducens]|jgi:chromosomal replication initiation ATPase DnaA|uniref:Helix-turn-helix domain-containing protein n=1 Tax=Pelagibacterium nitratireducens TaxID=1046114 RepID=A0ABZ2I077_9HYPH|tara:strand:+ start:9178 stop:9585 length:408 start_codon:yes stop_codon:yes gene_type:complete
MTVWISTAARLERNRLSAAQRQDCKLVVRTVSGETGVRYCDFFAPSRLGLHTAAARQLAMYLCHVLLGMTLTQVGQFFGRDRTTVAYACAHVEDMRDDGGDYDRRLVALEERIETARRQPCVLEVTPPETAHASV